MTEDYLPNVLFVDDEISILKLIEIQTQGHVNQYMARSLGEAMQILKEEDIHIIVTDQNLDNGEKGTDILSRVYIEYPQIRRIVLTSDLSLNTALVSINETSVHKYLIKPWKKVELLEMITSQYTLYLEEERKEKEFKNLKEITEFLRKRVYSNSKKMLTSIINHEPYNNSEEYKEQIISVIENLIEISKQYVQSFANNFNFDLLSDALSAIYDIELFATQYSMDNLKVYAKLLSGYTNLLAGDFQMIERLTIELHRVVYVQQNKNLPLKLHNEFLRYLSVVEKMKKEDSEWETMVLSNLNSIFNLNIAEIINISPFIFQFLQETVQPISHLAIIKDGITIFSMVDNEINPTIGSQIGSFVIALQDFFEVVLETSGRIETINHEKGTVAIWREGNISYVILSDQKSIYQRFAFRRFVEETIDIIKELPGGMTPTFEHETLLIEKLNSHFNCRIETVSS